MSDTLDAAALDQLFREARSQNAWQGRDVSESRLHELYELFKWGPTAANGCPARLLFVKSDAAKQRLKPCLSEGNVDKSMTAPVVCVIAYDLEFFEKLPKLFPHTDARSWYVDSPAAAEKAAFRNGTLQGAYLIMAARALGLDCGPMSGFDADKLNEEFFPDGKWKANFLCGLGYGDPAGVFPRLPRLDFDEAAKIV